MDLNTMESTFDKIADGLANDGYAVIDNFLSHEEVETIVQLPEFRNSLEYFQKAGIGKKKDLQINEAIRGDYIHWIDRTSTHDSVRIYLNRLEDLIAYMNKTLYLSLKDFEVHMTVYPAGS